MVITKEFVWAHLGKTGGTSVQNFFKKNLEKEIVFFHKNSDPKKHETFAMKENLPQFRVLNIRRLPFWVSSIASAIHNENKEKILDGFLNWPIQNNSRHHPYDPIGFVRIDDYLNIYEPQKVDFWIRTEFMEEDLGLLIKKFGMKKIVNVEILNTAIFKKIKFSKFEIKKLYDACPVWRELERKVYGGLLI